MQNQLNELKRKMLEFFQLVKSKNKIIKKSEESLRREEVGWDRWENSVYSREHFSCYQGNFEYSLLF